MAGLVPIIRAMKRQSGWSAATKSGASDPTKCGSDVFDPTAWMGGTTRTDGGWVAMWM